MRCMDPDPIPRRAPRPREERKAKRTELLAQTTHGLGAQGWTRSRFGCTLCGGRLCKRGTNEWLRTLCRGRASGPNLAEPRVWAEAPRLAHAEVLGYCGHRHLGMRQMRQLRHRRATRAGPIMSRQDEPLWAAKPDSPACWVVARERPSSCGLEQCPQG